jgi:hypothetical protein
VSAMPPAPRMPHRMLIGPVYQLAGSAVASRRLRSRVGQGVDASPHRREAPSRRARKAPIREDRGRAEPLWRIELQTFSLRVSGKPASPPKP